MKFDLDQLARRLSEAAQRADGLDISVSSFDLIISQDGHGTRLSESVPFASLFLSDQDVIGQALDRLQVPAAPQQEVTHGQ
jgi:hypothetical protein